MVQDMMFPIVVEYTTPDGISIRKRFRNDQLNDARLLVYILKQRGIEVHTNLPSEEKKIEEEWHETDYPDWQDAGKEVEMEDGPTGTLVVVDQTPGPDEAPLWGIKVGGTLFKFDYLKRWRFTTKEDKDERTEP